ncbi:MAG: hypothetical protein N3D10_03265 [Candidatus Micrarchaeota archaeon]|nr:hypothetical protein [Candidatus Micrarchaeota archaeon]
MQYIQKLKEKLNKTKKNISLFFKKALLTTAISSSILSSFPSCQENITTLEFSNKIKKPPVKLNYKQQRVALLNLQTNRYIVLDSNITKLYNPNLKDSIEVYVQELNVSPTIKKPYATITYNANGWQTKNVFISDTLFYQYKVLDFEANNGEKKGLVINYLLSNPNHFVYNPYQILGEGNNILVFFIRDPTTNKFYTDKVSITFNNTHQNIFVGTVLGITFLFYDSTSKIWNKLPTNVDGINYIASFYINTPQKIDARLNIYVDDNKNSFKQTINLSLNSGQSARFSVNGKEFYLTICPIIYSLQGILGAGNITSYVVSLKTSELSPEESSTHTNETNLGFNFADGTTSYTIIINFSTK